MRVEQGAVVFLVDTQHVNISRYVRQYPGRSEWTKFPEAAMAAMWGRHT